MEKLVCEKWSLSLDVVVGWCFIILERWWFTAGTGEHMGGGVVLDWAYGSLRVPSLGFPWCVFWFSWLLINLVWLPHCCPVHSGGLNTWPAELALPLWACCSVLCNQPSPFCKTQRGKHNLLLAADLPRWWQADVIYLASSRHVATAVTPLLTVSCNSWEVPEQPQTSFSQDL